MGNRPGPARGWEKERPSDATFWSDGTVTRFAYWGPWQERRWKRAGWKRALSRLVTTVVCATVTWGMLAHRGGTERVTAVVIGAAAGFGVVRFLLWLEIREHNRDVVRPLHAALTGIFDAPRPPEIPLDYATNRDMEILLWPPRDFTGGDRDREDVARALEAKLPRLEAPEIDWSRLHSHKPRILVRHSEPLPPRVTWRQIEPAVRAAGPSELIVGIGKKQQVTKVSVELDSPHFGISMGTGGGKSNLASFWLVQSLMRGDIALILDAKHFSHPWAFKDMDAEYGLLPNVGYARWIPDLHEAMVWLGQELSRRTLEAERIINAKGDLLGDVGPRLWIVAEEMNLATPLLKQHWADIRDKEQVKKSPALTGLGAVAFAGRAVKMHLIVIGQQLTAETLGGGSVRENIGVRCLARYTQNTWKMQAGDVPMPPSPSVAGRVQCIASGGVSETQVPLMDLEQVRELALAGRVTPVPADMPGIAAQPQMAQVGVPRFAALDMGLDQPSVLGMTLAEAIAENVLRRTLQSARKESQRPGFPAPLEEPRRGVASRYRPSELGAWEKERAAR